MQIPPVLWKRMFPTCANVMAAALFDRDLADTCTLSPDYKNAPSHKRHATKMRNVQEPLHRAPHPCETHMSSYAETVERLLAESCCPSPRVTK